MVNEMKKATLLSIGSRIWPLWGATRFAQHPPLSDIIFGAKQLRVGKLYFLAVKQKFYKNPGRTKREGHALCAFFIHTSATIISGGQMLDEVILGVL